MNEDTLLPFDLPSIVRKKVSVAFDDGLLSSDAGVLLLRSVEKKLGLAARLASCTREWRKPEAVVHPLEEMLGCGCLRSWRAMRTAVIAIRWGAIRFQD